jgi:hypothetical protein
VKTGAVKRDDRLGGSWEVERLKNLDCFKAEKKSGHNARSSITGTIVAD